MDVEQDAASAFLENAKRNIDVSFESIGVLPGERVTESVTTLKSSIRIGAGLVQINDAVITTVAGKLRYRPPATYFVESTTMRYMPKAGDHVVAIVDEKGGDFYKVNIFSGAMGMLGRLSFDGATKRNKPELKKGDYIYARVLQANKDVDTELTCTAASGVKKDWSSGESVSFYCPRLLGSWMLIG
jgi:exosome complex component RRP40